MEEICKDLPEECWALIVSRLSHHQQWESLSLASKKLLLVTNDSRSSLKVINPSIEVLSKQLRRFPCLKKIDFSEFSGSLQEALHQITLSGINVEELNISRAKEPPIQLLSELSSKMRNLKNFCCSESYLNNNAVKILSASFPSLEVLDISNPKGFELSDDGIVALSKNLKRLRKINLTGCPISDESVMSLISNCKHLIEIVLRFNSYVSLTGLSFAMQNSHSLSSLIFASDDFEPFEAPNFMFYSKQLSTIDLCNIIISDDHLYEIAKADLPLKSFQLKRCKNFTRSGIYALLKAYQSLKSFALIGISFLTDKFVMGIIEVIHNLISINFNECYDLTHASFVAVSLACPFLKHIGMNESSHRYTSDMPCALISANNPSLLSALISGPMVPCVIHICQNLEALKVHSNSHKLDISEILKHCRRLRILIIFCAEELKFNEEQDEQIYQLEHLSIDGWQDIQIDDQVLAMLVKRCPKLVDLRLRRCSSVTETGLKEVMKHCTQLRYINLDGLYQVENDFIYWMVSSCPFLRKIVLPSSCYFCADEKAILLRLGCLVIDGSCADEDEDDDYNCCYSDASG